MHLSEVNDEVVTTFFILTATVTKILPFSTDLKEMQPFLSSFVSRNGFSIPFAIWIDNFAFGQWARKKNLIFLTPLGWLIQKNKKKLDKRRWRRQEHSGFTPTHSLRDNKDDKIDQKLNFPSEWQRNKGTCHLLCNTNSSESYGKTKEKWRLFWGVFIWKIIFISSPRCRYLSALRR